MTEKIDKETAGLEVQRFFDSMDLYFDTDQMDDEDLTAFNKNKSRLIRAIQKGHLAINDDGEAVYVPYHKKSNHSEPITFHERSGASLMAMDKKKKGHDVAKTYAVMGDICNVAPNVFAGLHGEDVKICECLFVLLMD